LLMGIIFISRLSWDLVFSFKVDKSLDDSWTKHIRRIRVNDAGSDSIKEDFRAKIRRTPARNERSVAQYGGAKSITNDSPSSSSSGMSLAAALQILEENHDLTELSKQARNRNHAGRPRQSRRGRQRRRGRQVDDGEKPPTHNRGRSQARINANRNILQDQPIIKGGITARPNSGHGQNIPRNDIIQDKSLYQDNNLEQHSSRSPRRTENGYNQQNEHNPINQGDSGDCGPECQNLLHELDHPKEHSRCTRAGQVIDIWGYCRDVFQEERRDWDWWRNLRIFVHSGGNSWYNTYRPTAYEEGYGK